MGAYEDAIAPVRPGRSLGGFLRHWRTVHGMSQENLAAAANTTCRYISFIENGRAAPSRAMLERLAEALKLQAQHLDSLFMAAGYVPAAASSTSPPDHAHDARALIARVLEHHEPHPAVAVDREWTIAAANAAAERLLRMGSYPQCGQSLIGQNAIDIIVRPDGLRPHIHNWEEYTWRTLQYLHRLWAHSGELPATLARIRHHPDIVELEGMVEPPPLVAPDGTIVVIEGGEQRRFFQLRSRITTPGNPLEHDLRIELFFPHDPLDADQGDAASLRRPA